MSSTISGFQNGYVAFGTITAIKSLDARWRHQFFFIHANREWYTMGLSSLPRYLSRRLSTPIRPPYITTGGVVAHVELYQGGGVTRSAAVQILLVTGVTVRRHLTSRSRAAVLILVVTPVTDCRRELIQHLCYQRVMFMTGPRLCLKPHFSGKRLCTTFFTRPMCFYVFCRRRFYSICY